jgi:hypothetical protein
MAKGNASIRSTIHSWRSDGGGGAIHGFLPKRDDEW